MKIKMTKKFRLDELIKHIYENDKKNRVFIDDGENFAIHTTSLDAAVNIEHLKEYGGKRCISKMDTFTVEIEEELTEETEFDELYEYYWDKVDGQGIAEAHSKKTIRGIIEEHEEETAPLSIMIRNKIDNHPVLIWTKEHGIPEERIIEL